MDDEEGPLAVLAAHLAGLGYRVATARDGREALRRMAAERPDLVITDLQMPGLDGAGLCRRIKADPATSELPVLVVSGHQRIAEVARAAGADAWLAKPVSRGAVTRAARRLMGGPPGPALTRP
ncbi:MAG: response regulator [Candidatus Dormibacterales bacterium]